MTAKAAKQDVEAGVAELARTPRSNRDLEQKLAGFKTISEGLDYAARGLTGFNFYSAKGVLSHVMTYAELRRRALATARKLMSAGMKRGDRVAVIAETGPEFMAVFFGCQYAGLVPCPMPYTMYIGGKDAYVDRVTGMLRAAAACAVITSADLEGHVRAGAAGAGVEKVLTHEALRALPESLTKLEAFGPEEVAYIQYSSGSTSEPKGVLITQMAIMANTQGILRDGLRVTKNDRAFSWLPLYHDMGLVGFCLAPMMGQVTVDYISTPSFARRPALWLRLMSEKGASDVYLSANSPILIKINGNVIQLSDQPLTHSQPRQLLAELLSPSQLEDLEETGDLNIGIGLTGLGSFRLSAFKQRGTIAAVFRCIPFEIPSLDTLNLPEILNALVMEKRGLVLMVGATGTGKSTTLASMLEQRNQHLTGHILTIEDPIEFLFTNKKSVVNQREVGRDTSSLQVALKNALRQAPDCILIGEIRDRETMTSAISYSLSGHLVLATVREEHQAFYRRVFGHRVICEPRHYPSLTKPISLMALDYPLSRERVLHNRPFFRSTFFERRMLFGRTPLAVPMRTAA